MSDTYAALNLCCSASFALCSFFLFFHCIIVSFYISFNEAFVPSTGESLLQSTARRPVVRKTYISLSVFVGEGEREGKESKG